MCWQPADALQESVVHGLVSSQSSAVPGAQEPPAQRSPVVHTLLSLHGAVLLAVVHPVVELHPSVVHGLPSLQVTAPPGAHTVAAHASPVVHALPSEQGRVLAANAQPLAGLQASLVHKLLSEHAMAAPGTHTPPAQASPLVQTLPSVHAPVELAKTQPRVASHVSAVHGLLSLQVAAGPPWQAPALQASPWVQALPSLHPIALNAFTQPPALLQESVVQRLPSSQSLLGPGTQLPPVQASPTVHALPSVQATVLLLEVQPLRGSHVSTVQGLPSLQVTAVPGWQEPVAHTSPVVHALPSEHASELKPFTQPPAGLQESVVQGLLSSQLMAVPATQVPAVQVSPLVQTLPSEQGAELEVCKQPVAGSQLSSEHGLPSAHAVSAPPTHAPPLQLSLVEQAEPSSQGCALNWLVQPVSASQTSVVQGF